MKKAHVISYIIATALFCGIVCLIVVFHNKTNGDENMKQCFTIEDLSAIEIGVSRLNDICAIVPEDNVMVTAHDGHGQEHQHQGSVPRAEPPLGPFPGQAQRP